MKKHTLLIITFLATTIVSLIGSVNTSDSSAKDYLVIIRNKSTQPIEVGEEFNHIVLPGQTFTEDINESEFYEHLRDIEEMLPGTNVLHKINLRRSVPMINNKPIYVKMDVEGVEGIIELCVKGSCAILANKYPQYSGYVICDILKYPEEKETAMIEQKDEL